MTVRSISFIVALCFALTSCPVLGAVFESGEEIHITSLHRIEEDLYASGSIVRIDGYIGGDLCAAGSEVITNGEVAASQNIFAEELDHIGRCDGSLRAFAFRAKISGYIGRSALIYAFRAELGESSVIRGDVFVAGANVNVGGRIMGDVTAHAEKVRVTGNIDGNAELNCTEMVIAPPAVIKGDLIYTCQEQIDIDTSGGVVILGDIKWKNPGFSDEPVEEGSTFRSLVVDTSKIMASFLLGMILLYVFRRYAEETFLQLKSRPTISLAAGFLTLLTAIVSIIFMIGSLILLIPGMQLVSGELAAVGALLLVISILLIPISTLAGLSASALVYLGGIAFAPLIGYLVFRLVKKQPPQLTWVQFLIGLILISCLSALPYLGFVILLLISISGAGAIVLGVRHCKNRPDSLESPATPPDQDFSEVAD